jgi:HEAT repeat protein
MSSVFHIVGIVLAILAAIGLLIALYADRSKGRRRCPRCWFDMSATRSLLCPECGRTHKHEGRMYLTRRHWRWAVLFVVLLAGGRAVYEVPRIRQVGPQGYAPEWAMRRGMSYLPRLGPQWTARFDDMLTPDRPKEFWRDVVTRALAILDDPDQPVETHAWAAQTLARIQTGSPFHTASGGEFANQVRLEEVDPARAARVLTRHLASPDMRLRQAAAECLTDLRSYESVIALPRLIATLRARTPADPKEAWTDAQLHSNINAMLERPEAVRSVLIDDGDIPLPPSLAPLARIDAETPAAERLRILTALLDDADARVRVLAHWMLAFEADSDALALIARARADADPRVRTMSYFYAAMAQLSDAQAYALATSLFDDADPSARAGGLEIVERLIAHATTASEGSGRAVPWAEPSTPLDPEKFRAIEPRLLALVTSDPEWWVRRNASLVVTRVPGVSSDTLLAAAQSVVLDPQEDVWMHADTLIARLDQRAAELVTPLLARIRDPATSAVARANAIQAIASVGSERDDVFEVVQHAAFNPQASGRERIFALRALGQFPRHKDRLVPPLRELLSSDESTFRRLAREALLALGDPADGNAASP